LMGGGKKRWGEGQVGAKNHNRGSDKLGDLTASAWEKVEGRTGSSAVGNGWQRKTKKWGGRITDGGWIARHLSRKLAVRPSIYNGSERSRRDRPRQVLKDRGKEKNIHALVKKGTVGHRKSVEFTC